jgi:3D (Asp-Asp-Asp) domain-containing protein
MISVTFECEGQADCPFLLQVEVSGDGSTTTNIKMNTKWLCKTSRSHPTSTPLHDKFYVPFLLQVYVAGDWNGSTTTNIKINTK